MKKKEQIKQTSTLNVQAGADLVITHQITGEVVFAVTTSFPMKVVATAWKKREAK